MLRCDFSSVIGIIREYISEGNATTQPELIGDLFCTFLEKNDDFDFDNGQINRWIKGLAAVSPKIAEFYQRKSAVESLASDIETLIFPILYDTAMAAENIYTLVMNDISISEQKRIELTADYPEDIAAFMATVIIFAISRKFEKRDIKSIALGTLSPVVSDMIFDGGVPKPCKHFCGRDTELEGLHELLNTHNKVFIHGIAGIGKSEFVKAYASAHKKEYTNILYFQYNGSLQKMIVDMDFADDNSDDDETERFRKHNRFLRSLKDDTLIIVDNFNTTASKETKLDILMKYNCRVIFTTRSNFEIGTAFELTEISDIDTLVSLAGKFYSDLDSNRETVVKIIEAVYRHTLAIEMSARLLQKGMLEPDELLSALLSSSANPDSTDKIGINKDGVNTKATYYNHIRTLFSLYLLDEDKQSIMRCMVFISQTGIRGRMFAKWLGLNAMDNINELVELGFITNPEMDRISLLPMVRDIAIEDLCPSVTNCNTLIKSIYSICIQHGKDVPYYETLFSVIENIVDIIKNDGNAEYLLFLEDTFSYMEKYRYASGMRKNAEAMKILLSDENIGTQNDRALLLNNQASCEGLLDKNYPKAIALERKAISVCKPEDNLVLAANLNMNLGFLYHYSGDYDNAKIFIEKAMQLLSQANTINNDVIVMSRNYARLIAAMGEPYKAIEAMKKCAALVKSENTDKCTDYADLIFDVAAISLQIGNTDTAKTYFIKAFNIYREILPQADLTEKAELAADYLKRVGIANTDNFLTLTQNAE
ncbi:MAG: ATP-binding protein [Oscillospiraceae bacterium]|nr:ATP-binding protein [Oscillospiraceae bacterium]MBP1560700.1 ATP-binding protein [Oscillospiraceae bacterium]